MGQYPGLEWRVVIQPGYCPCCPSLPAPSPALAACPCTAAAREEDERTLSKAFTRRALHHQTGGFINPPAPSRREQITPCPRWFCSELNYRLCIRPCGDRSCSGSHLHPPTPWMGFSPAPASSPEPLQPLQRQEERPQPTDPSYGHRQCWGISESHPLLGSTAQDQLLFLA